MIKHKGINVFGVEINPRAKRQDTFIGSFDELPQNWEKKFEIIYSNSFDQSMKPEETANEWKRVLKPGGYIVFSFSYNKTPTESDPVGGIKLENVKDLFGGEIVYYDKYGSNYSDTRITIGSAAGNGSFNDELTVKNGNVGVGGIATPSERLHVDCGAPSSSDKTIALFQSESSRKMGFVWDDSTSSLGVATLTNHALDFHVNGNSSSAMTIQTNKLIQVPS